MGLVDDIKKDVKRSGNNKAKLVRFKPGIKVRVRFLADLDEGGHKIPFHDNYERNINHPCQELYDRECAMHDEEGVRTRDIYAWSVWDYEAKEVKILMGPVNSFSPIPLLVGFYETYGSITDRDYVITQNGTGTGKSFSVVPMDKSKFKNEKAKPFSESKVLSILDKAYPADDEDSDSDDDDEPKKKSKKGKKQQSSKKKRKPDPDEDEEDEDDEDSDDEDADEEDEEDGYEDLSPKELYQLCKKRGISVKPKKDEDYYIEKLEADDEDSEDDDDEDEDDD